MPIKEHNFLPRLRPFVAGEFIENEDGTRSTELTVTQQTKDGQWVNIPSLWKGPKGPVQFQPDDETGLNMALNLFEKNSKPLPRFKTLEEAVAAAKAASEQGGRGFVREKN
jgi:hypothetical protein